MNLYLFFILNLICMGVLSECVSVHVCGVPMEARRGIDSSGSRVTDSSWLPCGFWEPNLGLWKNQVL